MESPAEHHEIATGEILQKPKLSYWRRLGGGSLFVSIVLHAILLAVGVVWIVQTIEPPPEKVVDFMPKGGGGPAPQNNVQNVKRNQMVKSNASRIAAKGVSTNFTLPMPEANTSTSALASLSSGSMGTGGLGGGGAGLGQGPSSGLGTMDGAGMLNPFGMRENPNQGALIGTFYDFKQTPERQPTDLDPNQMRDAVQEFGRRNWREQTLSKFYQLSQKVYQTKIYIPLMSANNAPAAFNAEKEVEPSRWVIIYRGTVVAPKSGRFRFAGCADDILAVRFDNKNVLDFGFTRVTTGRDYPMEQDHPKYQYANAKQYERMGGLGVGPAFRTQAGRSYPIEILIGEVPGGQFCATLMIEEIGVTYEKTPEGSPILPLFRTDSSVPPPSTDDCAIPYDNKGPVWRIAGSGTKMDI